MRLVFLGPPGAGKGSLAVLVGRKLGIPTVSTGDLFREAIRTETPLGARVKEVVATGALVPDELTLSIVEERLGREDALRGFILDGFPRTIAQAEALERTQALDAVVNFVVSDEEVVSRLSNRRVCCSCGAIYNTRSMPPGKDGTCDVCGGALTIRRDDVPESIANRLRVYKSQTAPLIRFYSERSLLKNIDSSVSPERSLEQMRGLIGQ
jgi:adenylate kinase